MQATEEKPATEPTGADRGIVVIVEGIGAYHPPVEASAMLREYARIAFPAQAAESK